MNAPSGKTIAVKPSIINFMKILSTAFILSTMAAAALAQSSTTVPAARRAPAVATPPPAVNTAPPAANTPPPAANTPPPAGATPPPAGATPPPAGATPTPSVNAPPPGTAIQPGIGNNQNIQPGLNQSVQPAFQSANSQLYNQPNQIPNSGSTLNGQYPYNPNNPYNNGSGYPTVGTNSLPGWRTNQLPSRGYPTNLPVRPATQGQ